ncbi:MAG: TonB-dependent receptor [Saprospiraceae bacterium]|nr:TonB-dependent receptor [Saprospiraceae bacterium]MDW8484412.1 TonB-dependent receptor [Saprospiraceae bacterium]
MKKLCLLFTLVSCSLPLFAQKTDRGALRGNVFDKESAQPIAFATIQLEGPETRGTTTDINGFFSIADLPAGTYRLKVTYIGYDDLQSEVSIKGGEVLFKNINLQESGQSLEEIVISGKKEQARSEIQVSKISVTPKQIRSLPSTGGQADIAQYLTVLPGVIFTGDQGGQLYIRGGSPVQNRILLDGMTIYNPFHSIGFFSIFETELIRNVDVLTGGFNAEHGGRISAIVDVKTREGNRKRLAGLVSASPFQARAMIEGPIVPLREEGGSSVSFVLAGKQALIDRLGKQLYPYVNDGDGIPFAYRDLYGKLSLMTGSGSKANFFGFNYRDGVRFAIADFNWQSSGGGMDFTLIPSNSNTVINGVLTYSTYSSRIQEADRQPRTSGINGFFASLNFINFDRHSEFRYGLELNGFRTDFQFVNFRGFKIEQIENTTELAFFLRWKRKIGPLVLEPGFRFQYYLSLNDISPEPRLGLKYNVTENFRLKAAGGWYSQNLLATVNERDVVNLFVGFLSGPEETVYKPGSTERIDHRLQKAVHGVAGFEIDLPNNIDLNVEGYYKDFTQLLALNRFKSLPQEPNYITETGKAYGIDFSAKWEAKRFYVWSAYSYAFVTRFDGQQEYPPVFDRRHNFNIVTTYQAGSKKVWELSARWNLGSGFPFTQTQGFYTVFDFSQGINTDVLTGNGTLGILYASRRNGGRLPYYHRLDVSIKRTFNLSKYAKAEIIASATNLYNRPNIFYFDRVRYQRVNQLPILPSLSMTLQF